MMKTDNKCQLMQIILLEKPKTNISTKVVQVNGKILLKNIYISMKADHEKSQNNISMTVRKKKTLMKLDHTN